jgi:hypothetical protein
MKPIGITVVCALVVLSIAWTLVRADIFSAEILRFMPAVLALIAAVGIAYTIVRPKKSNHAKSKSGVKQD